MNLFGYLFGYTCYCGGKLRYIGKDHLLGGDLYKCEKCPDKWSLGDSLDGHGKHWIHYDADDNVIY